MVPLQWIYPDLAEMEHLHSPGIDRPRSNSKFNKRLFCRYWQSMYPFYVKKYYKLPLITGKNYTPPPLQLRSHNTKLSEKFNTVNVSVC